MSDSVGSVSVEVVPDARGWSEKLRAQIRDVVAHVRVEADTSEADRQLADTNLLVDHLDGRTANIKVDVDKSSLGGIQSIFSSISGAGAAIGGLGPALIPLGAGALGLGAALGGPLSAAAGGLGAFAVAATVAVKQIDKATKAGQALTPIQKQFVAAQQALGAAFGKIDQRSILGPLIDGMGLLAKLMPFVAPLLKTVAGALDSLIQSASKFTDTGVFRSLAGFFTHETGVALKLGGEALGNIALGIAQIFRALTPQGNRLLRDFVSGTASFAKNAGHSGFVDALKRDLPLFTGLVGNLFKLVGGVVGTLEPYGEAVLTVLDKITGALSKIPDLAGPLLGGLLAGAFLGPEAGGAVAVVLGLADAFTHLYQNSRPLRNVLHELGDYFMGTWLPIIKNAAQQVLPSLQAAFKDVSKTFRDNKGFLEVVGKAIVALGSAAVIGGILAVAGAIRGLAKAFQYVVGGLHNFADEVLTGLRVVTRGTALFVRGVLNAFGLIVDGAAAAFGWLPGIGGKVKAAQAAFHTFANNAVNSISGVGDRLAALQRQIDEVGHSHPSFKVIAQIQSAIDAMERVQALTIRDKNFNIYAHYNAIERTPGPGGGIGQNPHGSGGGGSSGGGAGRTPVHVHLDDSGRHALTGFMEGTADRVYHANRGYEDAQAGQ